MSTRPAQRHPRSDPEDARLFKLVERACVDAQCDPMFAITGEEPAVLAAGGAGVHGADRGARGGGGVSVPDARRGG